MCDGFQNIPLQWRHNDHDGVSNHLRLDCLFRRRSKKASKVRVTGLCEGNSPVTGEFPAQRASNTENVSIWWRHHDVTRPQWLNSLAPVRCGCNLKLAIFKLISNTGILSSSIRRMTQDLTHDKSTLVQVMARCWQATSLYRRWPRSMSAYGVTMPQSVKQTTWILFFSPQHLYANLW